MDADFVKPWIRKLSPYVPGATVEGCIKLSANENNYGPSPKVVACLNEHVGSVNRYPCRDREVEEAVAAYAGVEAEQVLVGNGSDEIIGMLLQALDGNTAGFTPSFIEYKLMSDVYGIPYTQVPLGDDFSFWPESFIEQTAGARVLFLCSPNNPTGGVIEEEAIRQVCETGKTVVVDEAYHEFHGKTAAPLLKDYTNLILLRTFAKAVALAGLRVGYALGDADHIQAVKAVKQPFNVNSLAQAAAVAALDDVAYMRSCVEKIQADRARLTTALEAVGTPFPSQANFILVDVSPSSATDVYERFLEKKVVLRSFGRFPGFDGEFIRVAVGTSEETDAVIAALEEF